MSNEIAKPGEWKRRRRIIHATLSYCALAVPALTVWSPDSNLTHQTVLALIGLSGAVIGSYVFGAVWDVQLFDAKTVIAAVRTLGGDAIITSDAVSLSGPEMVASGLVVPLSMESKIPNTEFMAVMVQKNPIPMIAAFVIPPGTDAAISTRIKMGETSTIYGIARANGKYYVGSTMIKVRAGGGGCG